MPTARRTALLVAITALALPGCSERSGDPFRPGTLSDGGSQSDGGGTPITPRPDGSTASSCVAQARWIYLVDSANALLRYEPDSGSLTSIGTLACPSSGTPFSMAVDRNATAYVLHNDHRIYRVSTTDASCTATTFAPDQMGFELFGMGFVADASGSANETLFISGGPEEGIGSGRSVLGRIDVGSWTVSRIGNVDGSPELTGTGTAELWGFFPDGDPMAVRQLDKTTAATITEIDVSSIDPSIIPTPAAWAFAFWGGRYYIFYQGAFDDSTGIYRVTPGSTNVETVRTDIGYRIVGAGVSTCAPTDLI
ncbi:hypothetical protein [Sandaracinus amylolyticus]|uniref:Lipoprotein n=1 Tax=Sandaracinus amylolyticus TaxID=927083 RepID=A0A0F6SD85_9BACT|nr:hypothetical protein [Sandaracinus amylolyticus]AKF03004.1 hypothetical protein DB32_000152 [Sandaracinus amylolyticus]